MLTPSTDSQGRRIILLGTIDAQPALLLAERAAFSTSPAHLTNFASSLSSLQNLGDNDIYRWYLARSAASSAPPTPRPESQPGGTPPSPPPPPPPHDLKLNLIHPCTAKHVRKYSPQRLRYVLETPDVYRHLVRPWIARQRDEGRLDWIFNILEGRTEQEDVLYRSWTTGADEAPSPPVPPAAPTDTSSASSSSSSSSDDDERFLLLPDLNWDRKTVTAMHLLALPLRRDKWSIRDLGRRDVAWLERLVARVTSAVAELYGGGVGGRTVPEGEKGGKGEEKEEGGGDGVVDADMVKMYLHYQPTYHHLHIHVVHVNLDAGPTQAVGKAIDLRTVIGMLKALPAGERHRSTMADVEIGYTIGEGSELWETVWGPLKRGEITVPGEGSA